jgi:hypothetical protein
MGCQTQLEFAQDGVIGSVTDKPQLAADWIGAMSEPDLTERRMVVEDEFLMARRLAAPLKAWGVTLSGLAATIGRALSLLARARRVDLALVDVNLRAATAFAVVDAPPARRVAFAFTTGYGASTTPERYRDAGVHQKPLGKVEIAKIASALVLPASSP